MLRQRLRDAWSVRKRAVPISSLYLASQGLVLGAGTIVVAANGTPRLEGLKGQEARVLALLSAACGREVSPSVLGNIERPAKSWSEGDDLLAAIHLAHAGLREPQDSPAASRRLFMADGLMKAGTSPLDILDALDFDPSYVDAVEKLYNPLEPRVPAGNSVFSGRWTAIASFLAELNATQARRLGVWALVRLGVEVTGAVAVAGLLVFPSPNRIRVEGKIRGLPGGRYW